MKLNDFIIHKVTVLKHEKFYRLESEFKMNVNSIRNKTLRDKYRGGTENLA